MFALRRKEGEWLEIQAPDGSVLAIRCNDSKGRTHLNVQLAFLDPEKRFKITRLAEPPSLEHLGS